MRVPEPRLWVVSVGLAIVGGLLEYNSMYLGFQALYLMAIGCYVLAFSSEHIFANGDAVITATPT